MTDAERLRAGGWDDPPVGGEYRVFVDDDWRVVGGKRCRSGAGPGRPACGRPSVAELKRGRVPWGTTTPPNPSWWAYCEDHMYGRWIEDGRVLEFRLRGIDAPIEPGFVRSVPT